MGMPAKNIIEFGKKAAWLRNQGRAEASLQVLRALQTSDEKLSASDQAYILVGIGQSYKMLEQFLEAKTAFRDAVELDWHNPIAHRHLGHAFVSDGEYGEAQYAFEEVIRIWPNDVDARKDLQMVQQILAAAPSRIDEQHKSPARKWRGSFQPITDPADPIAKLKAEIEANPRMIGPRFALAQMLVKSDPDNARSQLSSILEIAPQDSPARALLRKLEKN